MKFTEFKIKNFKGIEDLTLNLEKSPNANIFTLVGLNESGKTTILEAINTFHPLDESLMSINIQPGGEVDYHSYIPISRRDNFTDTISIVVKLKLEPKDLELIKKFVVEETAYEDIDLKKSLTYFRHYSYENSEFKEFESRWDGFNGYIRDGEGTLKFEKIKGEDNKKLAKFCRSLIPSILYFPNFLFDFPSRIYLNEKKDSSRNDVFYRLLIQDILYCLDNGTNIKTHLVDRMLSKAANSGKNLDSLIKKMERKVSDVIFGSWNKVFKRHIKDMDVKISYNIDDKGEPYLEFNIESDEGSYQLSERSLGFKWFFIFLLLTQFRRFREGEPKNVIFLFDEPASNLHSLAQRQLLESFDSLTENSKVIYTTHSHHLINPNWLESTYVVKNEGFHLDKPEVFNITKTNIIIESYRDFATKHPHNTAYFQPILDVLEYSPSALENIPDCVFLEGKNDFYTLNYFNEIILNKRNLNLAPSTGSGNLDTLISLYLGWGRNFIVLLDSDKAGKREKDRYLEKFGAVLKNRLFLLSDIDSSYDKKAMESAFLNDDAFRFQLEFYPTSEGMNKTHFNRSVQESLINRSYFEFSAGTLDNFELILGFIERKLKELKI